MNGQKLSGTSPATKDYTKFKRKNLTGSLDLAARSVTLTVKPVVEKWQAMNLRSLTLQPVK